VNDDDLRLLRARSQRLLDERLTDATALVRELVGVQAQEPSAAALSIRARTRGLTRAAVDRALVEERSIVRTWAMRGTIHLVPAEDTGWLTELLAPLSRRSSHRRLAQLGVPERDRPPALAAIRAALAEHGPLTRAELMEHVARTGVSTAGQAAAHLTHLAAIEGTVCFGPPRGAKPTFVLRDDWLGRDLRRLPRHRALTELARRYASAHGPAAPEDLSAWSGLPLRDARAGWAATPAGRADPPAEAPPDPPVTRLLPAFDTYLLGYRSRDLAVPSEHSRRVWPGGGIVRQTVVANGLAVGTWRRTGADLSIEPFPGFELDAADEVADVNRFLDN
jgi:winged helix DNA-binding protein